LLVFGDECKILDEFEEDQQFSCGTNSPLSSSNDRIAQNLGILTAASMMQGFVEVTLTYINFCI
jgi:hypothetical protein